MPLYIDEAQQNTELLFEQQKLEAMVAERERARVHELNMLKAKTELERAGKRSQTRIRAVERVLVAIVKLPTLLLLIPLVGLLIACKREVPHYLVDYLSL